MPHIRTHFSPQKHGFGFPNRFDLLPSIRLPTGARFDLGTVIIGLCGGMCFAALDYYLADAPLPEFKSPEQITPNLLKYLHRRQRDSIPLRILRKIWDWAWSDDEDLSRLTAQVEWPRLRYQLDQGQPVVLLLMRTRGIENPTLNHQVLATGYDLDPDHDRATIYLYDPNYPGQETFMVLDLQAPEQERQVTQSTGEPVRGFFGLNYRLKSPRA